MSVVLGNCPFLAYIIIEPRGKAWTTIDRLSTTWTSDFSDKIKPKFIQDVAMSILLSGCTTCTLKKCLEKKCCLEQLLEASPFKTTVIWPLTSHLTNNPSKMSKTCCALSEKQRQTHKWCSLIDSYISVGQQAETYFRQLFVDSGCSWDNWPRPMADRDRWQEKVKGIDAVGTLL